MAESSSSRFRKHAEIIQLLVAMTVTPDTEMTFISDVAMETAFHLPSNGPYATSSTSISTSNIGTASKFVCKSKPKTCFDTVREAILFMLNDLFEEIYSQHLYEKLIKSTSLTQKAKLWSIGALRKNRLYHFRKYNDCMVASEGIQWLIASKLAKDKSSAIDIGNTFIHQKFLKHVIDAHLKFSNAHLFFVFDDAVIDTKLISEGYAKQHAQLLHHAYQLKEQEVQKQRANIESVHSNNSHENEDDGDGDDNNNDDDDLKGNDEWAPVAAGRMRHGYNESNLEYALKGMDLFSQLSAETATDCEICRIEAVDDVVNDSNIAHGSSVASAASSKEDTPSTTVPDDKVRLSSQRMTVVVESVPDLPEDTDDENEYTDDEND